MGSRVGTLNIVVSIARIFMVSLEARKAVCYLETREGKEDTCGQL